MLSGQLWKCTQLWRIEQHDSTRREAVSSCVSLDASRIRMPLYLNSQHDVDARGGGGEDGDWRRDRHVARTR